MFTEPSATFMKLPFTSDIARLDIAIAGVPWDGGTNLPVGSRHGPGEIRRASQRLRHYHPYHGFAAIDVCVVADVGDAPINPFDQEDGLRLIEAFYAELAEADVKPVSAGGDHLISLPILRAIARQQAVGLVHFDAHTDTADASAEGTPYSASTPFRRAVEEGLVDPKRGIQIGIRGSVRNADKFDWARQSGMRILTMDDVYDMGPDAVAQCAREVAGAGPTYVTFDIDGIDPSFAPGTGTRVVGGLTTYESQRILRGLKGLNLVGGDVVEVSPPYDVGNITALVGATLIFEILTLVADAELG